MSDIDTLKEETTLNRNRYHTLSSEVAIVKGKVEMLEGKGHYCLKEQDWGTLWEIIKTHNAHVAEGEANGGFRDRLLKAELDLKSMKERFWQSSLIGGLMGALIGSGSKEGINLIIKMFTGH